MPENTVTEQSHARRKKPAHWAVETASSEVATTAIATKTPEYPYLAARASIVRLEEGLYALDISATTKLPSRRSGVALPAIHLSAPPAGRLGSVEIMGTSGHATTWIGHDGGTVVVKSPPGGGNLWVTAYGFPDEAVVPPLVEPRRLDRPRSNGSVPPSVDVVVIEPHEIRTEI